MTTPGGSEAEHVPLEDIVDVRGSVEFYRRYGDDHIDRFDGEHFCRAVRSGDGYHLLSLTADAGLVPAVRVSFWPPLPDRDLGEAGGRVRLFKSHDPAAWSTLLASDHRLRRVAAENPGRRTLLIPDVLHALARSITAQQVSVTAAVAIRARIAVSFGDRVGGRDDGVFAYALSAARLACAGIGELRACGLSERKALSLRELATAVLHGELLYPRFRQMTDNEVRDTLCARRGLGVWSAEWFLARTLDRPTVVATDLVVRKAVGALYQDGVLPSPDDVRMLTSHWGRCAGAAQQTVLDRYQYRMAGK